MKAIIVGYGKMGHTIEQLCPQHGIEVVHCADNHQSLADWLAKGNRADVAFEFTQPEAARSNLELCLSNGISVVCGTTGWYHHLEEMKKLVQKLGNVSLFYAPNFSVGVRIATLICELLARATRQFPEYSVAIAETHHTQKKDAPSGTAILLAEKFIGGEEKYTEWQLTGEAQLTQFQQDSPNALPIIARREGRVPGIHTVKLEGSYDTITLTHSAKGREGFAAGAIAAARFIEGKTGIFTMDDLLPSK